MKALVLTLLFLLTAPSEAKIYSRCELASVLNQNWEDRYPGDLDYWICMAYYASKYNTQAVDVHRSGYYGIFQIANKHWCTDDNFRPTRGCNKPCSAFIDDDITDDIACAKRIWMDHLPSTKWWPWTNNCIGPNMSKWSRGCKG
ncbi:lysozyme C, milk isozyme-like isoform X1 [Ahaetulla prasina]|uniref:lysozyme C, milk isozyme-like isoform X1 n=2 Tax=Ahaetulla prasina TaxID=499056 RepID=UPI002649EF99|nr:lysozyme C, milk isozyme-like isoform X1 [Ahaetulla prasina]